MSTAGQHSLYPFIPHRQHCNANTTINSVEESYSQPCYDWIFSSGSNVHIAIDKSAFRNYIPFETFALTIADQRRVLVQGVGEVDLKIRCRPGARDSRVISLENVLHVPSWCCNIISDVYFMPPSDFDHKWSATGVSFTKKQNHKRKAWGYTDGFCGLERLVLARKLDGRSPMLEDKDREVWSVNLHWPQHQRAEWEDYVARQMKREAAQLEALRQRSPAVPLDAVLAEKQASMIDNGSPIAARHRFKTTGSSTAVQIGSRRPTTLTESQQRRTLEMSEFDIADQRTALGELDQNAVVTRPPGMKLTNLKTTLSTRRLLKNIKSSPSSEKTATRYS